MSGLPPRSRFRRPPTLDWLLPLAVLAGLTIPFWTTDLDMALASRFHTPGAGWTQGDELPWRTLTRYGVIPAWVVAVSALGVAAASFRSRRARPHRRAAIYLVLAMSVGPGLIVNDVFKKNWGRPRPRDLVVFGGDRDYVAPFVKSPREKGNSFASGHAATGFYLLTPYFILRGRRRILAAGFVVLGIGYGSLMGLARMMQGAHFASDVLWALGFVYLTGLALSYLIRPAGAPPHADASTPGG